jgi:DNA recombination protein RmuC
LKLFDDLWKRDRQSKHVMVFVKRAKSLYEKFVLFAESLAEVGQRIRQSQESYDRALSRLRDDKDSLYNQVNRLEEVGMQAGKRRLQDVLPPGSEEDEC